MAGTLSQKVVDGPHTVRRRLRWTKVLDWLSLRASPSKKACEAIDRTPMPIGSHHPRPDSPAPLEVAAHCAPREKSKTNAARSDEMR